MKPLAEHKQIENCRRIWAQVAKENGWYEEPFYVQVWIDTKTGKVFDSVAWPKMTTDFVVYEDRLSTCCDAEIVNGHCDICVREQ